MAGQTETIKCPFCGHDGHLEKIHIGYGQPVRWWRPDDLLPRLVIMMAGKINTYRCERCHYVLMFARD